MKIINKFAVFEIELRHVEKPVLHTHDTHEFFFCKEGSGEQHTDNGIVRMKKNDFYFFPEGQLHIGNGSKNESCIGLVLNVQDSSLVQLSEDEPELIRLLNFLRDSARLGRNKITMTEPGTESLLEIFYAMIEENRMKKKGFASALKIHIGQLLLLLLRESKIPVPSGEPITRESVTGRKIEEICRFLEHNYMSHLTIEKMAKMSGLSRSHFHSLFRENTGKTFISYLNSVRCAEASKLLRESDLETEHISRVCGFESLSHFYCVFRKETGKKPSSLRK